MAKLKFPATILAIFIGMVMAAAAIMYGATSYFLSIEGLIIVIGGSVANAFLSYRKEDVLTAFATIKRMFRQPPSGREKLHKDIMQLMMWSYVVQTKDFIGLEQEYGKKVRDPLLRYGIDLTVTGYSAENIRDMMRTVADAEFERHCTPVTVLRNMAATAPAFGMVGTLIGMVLLLKNVGLDITSIGGGLAIAMLSTLYGILVARLVCLPAADKLLQNEEIDHFRNYMLAEGFAMLAEKQTPFYMQDRLNSFLEPAKHFNLENYQQFTMQRRSAMAA